MRNIAVVILNYNGRELLSKFLPGVVQHSGTARIVVVDNASTDDSTVWVRQNFPGIELITLPNNFGFCGGYNVALKKIQADYYVLLNSDVEVTQGWLDPLTKALDQNPAAAAVQPKILSHRQPTHFEYAGAAGGYLDSLGYPFCRGRLFYVMEEDEQQYNDQKDIFWASGACMMVRSELFHQMGGFDEDFFAHMEEIDLCWRWQRAGHRILYEGSSTVYHLGGATLHASNPRKTYLNFRNGLSLLYKNLPTGELLIKFPLRIILDWIASIKFLFDGTTRDAWAVMRAHFNFISRWGREHDRRKHSRNLGFKRIPSRYSGSVVWKFFILGVRKYTDLGA
ncbi:MAG: glycosyltransferase family 2 protein [Cyclobacteriaceae bacterium]|nr:glycosyltransferase family 2 protein [Cyclobacteriaceae bacterium]